MMDKFNRSVRSCNCWSCCKASSGVEHRNVASTDLPIRNHCCCEHHLPVANPGWMLQSKGCCKNTPFSMFTTETKDQTDRYHDRVACTDGQELCQRFNHVCSNLLCGRGTARPNADRSESVSHLCGKVQNLNFTDPVNGRFAQRHECCSGIEQQGFPVAVLRLQDGKISEMCNVQHVHQHKHDYNSSCGCFTPSRRSIQSTDVRSRLPAAEITTASNLNRNYLGHVRETVQLDDRIHSGSSVCKCPNCHHNIYVDNVQQSRQGFSATSYNEFIPSRCINAKTGISFCCCTLCVPETTDHFGSTSQRYQAFDMTSSKSAGDRLAPVSVRPTLIWNDDEPKPVVVSKQMSRQTGIVLHEAHSKLLNKPVMQFARSFPSSSVSEEQEMVLPDCDSQAQRTLHSTKRLKPSSSLKEHYEHGSKFDDVVNRFKLLGNHVNERNFVQQRVKCSDKSQNTELSAYQTNCNVQTYGLQQENDNKECISSIHTSPNNFLKDAHAKNTVLCSFSSGIDNVYDSHNDCGLDRFVLHHRYRLLQEDLLKHSSEDALANRKGNSKLCEVQMESGIDLISNVNMSSVPSENFFDADIEQQLKSAQHHGMFYSEKCANNERSYLSNAKQPKDQIASDYSSNYTFHLHKSKKNNVIENQNPFVQSQLRASKMPSSNYVSLISGKSLPSYSEHELMTALQPRGSLHQCDQESGYSCRENFRKQADKVSADTAIGDRIFQQFVIDVEPSGDCPVHLGSPQPEIKQTTSCKETRIRYYPAFFKLYMEQHVENIMKSYYQRLQRRHQLEEEMEKLKLPESERNHCRKWLFTKESQHNRLKRTRMDISMFETVTILGRGAFGDVSLVRRRDSGVLYAIKTLKKKDVLRKKQIAHVKAERDLLVEVDSEWVVKLYYSFQDLECFYLVMEYIPGGDLMGLLMKLKIFDHCLAQFYTAELVLAIESVHKLGYIHRDIKPDNILICQNGHLKLTDFGLCTGFHWTHDTENYNTVDSDLLSDTHCQGNEYAQYSRRNMARSLVGTPNYIAPEVLQQLGGYTSCCDWWSVGVIVYEMVVGHPPFLSDTALETQLKVINWRNTLRIPMSASVSNAAADLILRLCCDQCERLGRGGATEIKGHTFFTGIDFEGLQKQVAPYIPQIAHPLDTSNFEAVEPVKPQNSDPVELTFHGASTDSSKHAFLDFTFRRFFDSDSEAVTVQKLT